jgi:hypothetical protein
MKHDWWMAWIAWSALTLYVVAAGCAAKATGPKDETNGTPGGSGGQGGTAGSGGSTTSTSTHTTTSTTTTSTTTTTTTTHTGPCLSCGDALTSSAYPPCAGTSEALFTAYHSCMCDGKCKAKCLANLCAGSSQSGDCQTCQYDPAMGCGSEYNACLND